VIGLAQVGSHAHADRFTYVPLVGLFIVIAWGARDLAELVRSRLRWRTAALNGALAGLAVVTAIVFGVMTRVQAEYWHDGFTTWQHALDVTSDNFTAEDAIGGLLIDRGQPADAIPHLTHAIEMHPGFAGAHYNFALALTKLGRLDDAIAQYEASIKLEPIHP